VTSGQLTFAFHAKLIERGLGSTNGESSAARAGALDVPCRRGVNLGLLSPMKRNGDDFNVQFACDTASFTTLVDDLVIHLFRGTDSYLLRRPKRRRRTTTTFVFWSRCTRALSSDSARAPVNTGAGAGLTPN